DRRAHRPGVQVTPRSSQGGDRGREVQAPDGLNPDRGDVVYRASTVARRVAAQPRAGGAGTLFGTLGRCEGAAVWARRFSSTRKRPTRACNSSAWRASRWAVDDSSSVLPVLAVTVVSMLETARLT